MNYTIIYNDLIKSRQARKPTTVDYYENHHILPRCLGGTDDKSNLVKLTAREHYLAHWLLTKIHPSNFRLWSAFSLMAGQLSPKATRLFSPSAYARCKQAHSIATSLRFKAGWSPMASASARAKISYRMTINNPIANNPSLNHTAKPVTVYFSDGTSKTYSYGKEASDDLGIPYSTWKYSRKHGKPGIIPKYGVTKIIQHEKADL
jgi:hypothetical protein